jgi:hypothetical protein
LIASSTLVTTFMWIPPSYKVSIDHFRTYSVCDLFQIPERDPQNLSIVDA